MNLINTSGLRDPATEGAVAAEGKLCILPATFWAQFTQAELAVFCHKRALYCLPTIELVEWLKERIAGRRAIEIGSGTGVLAEALGIPATDNRMQEWASVIAHYRMTGQPLITYGEAVQTLDAEAALAEYQPEVVVAAWVTHKYQSSEHWREGNMYGVEEQNVLRQAEYIFIGHDFVHRHKPIWLREHETFHFPWLVSRATSPGNNHIKVWLRGA